MEKVPCKECDALILPATAKETGGICMACMQGIRKNIEQSKEFYNKQKERDPVRDLWLSLVDRVHKKPGGFEGLIDDEKLYFAVSVLDGEVYNGGMVQFFSNSSGEYFDEVVAGLKSLGAESSLKLLQQATKILFGNKTPDKGRATRWDQMRQIPESLADQLPEWCIELDSIDRQYCDDPDNLSVKLTEFALSRGLIASS